MKKEKNALRVWWYSLIAIPIFLFISKYIWTDSTDSFVFSWITILLSSLLLQIFIFNKGIEYGRKVVHVLFIVFTVITTMFTSYFVHKYLDIDVNGPWILRGEWFDYLLLTLVQSAILTVFKLFYWVLLVMHHKQISQRFDHRDDLIEERTELLRENDELKLENIRLKQEKEDSDKTQEQDIDTLI